MGVCVICVLPYSTPVLADYLRDLQDEVGSTGKAQQKNSPATTKPNKTTPGKQNNGTGYLSEIESEAGDLSVDGMSSVKTKNIKKEEAKEQVTWDINKQGFDTLQPKLSQEDFEKNLERNYFGTYVFYKSLAPVSKSLVYKAYQREPNIENVRKTISSLAK